MLSPYRSGFLHFLRGTLGVVFAASLISVGSLHATPPHGLLAPAGGYTPYVRFAENRIDSVIATKDPATTDLIRSVNTTRKVRVIIGATMTNVNKAGFTPDTGVACQVGNFYQTNTLGDDPAYKPGVTKATFPLYDGLTFDKTGEPVKTGTIVYDWSKTYLTITVIGYNVGSIIEAEPTDLFPNSGGNTAPLGRFVYRNRVPIYINIDGNEGFWNQFYNAVVRRRSVAYVTNPQTFTLTNFAAGRTRDVTPPAITSVSTTGGNTGLRIVVGEEFPQYLTLTAINATSGGNTTTQNTSNTLPMDVYFNVAPFATLYGTSNPSNITTTGPVTSLNHGDSVVLTWTDEDGNTRNSTYYQP